MNRSKYRIFGIFEIFEVEGRSVNEHSVISWYNVTILEFNAFLNQNNIATILKKPWKGIEYYHNLMPETSGGEVTYEKTPKYMVIPEVPGKLLQNN